jgi:glycosyltransferase involved in cell wall biosynthesis
MSATPTISVIIPAYDAADFLSNAIDSALAQTHPPQEILVVDDGSHDNTVPLVEAYASPVRLIRQDNAGPSSARNHAARVAKSEWLAFLDADDRWLPAKLERQIAYADDDAVALIHCPYVGAPAHRLTPGPVTFDRLWQKNCVSTSSVLIRRSVFESLGGFDESLISAEDYNLWLRLAAAGWKIATCPDELWQYTPAPDSLSSKVDQFLRSELASVESLGARLNLPAALVRAKRLAIYEQYGRDLFYTRDLKAARRLLGVPLRQHPTPLILGQWLATFLPASVVNLGRR